MRVLCLVLLGLHAASAVRDHPVTGAMEGIGNTAGTVQGGVSSAGNTVGADKVGEGAGAVVTGAGDTVGSGATAVGGAATGAVGAEPEHVEVMGGGLVPTSLQCVINLTIQYMGIYTAIAIGRMVADFMGANFEHYTVGEDLTRAAITVNYAPMLAILFLACRMRVNWLTQSKGNPPIHVQQWMYAATYAVLAMTLVTLVVPLFTGEKVVHDEHGNIDEEHAPFKNQIAAIGFTLLKYAILIGLYIGAIVVIYGTYNYVPPAGSSPFGDKIPPVAPAVACTMILTSMYFIVYAGIQFGKTFQSFSGVDSSKITGALQGAISTMFFAPMAAVLFIGARMRALQMDPINGAPQKWAQNCFYAITYAILIQCILAVCVPLILGGSIKKGDKGEGDIEYKVENKMLGTCLLVFRWFVMLSVYLGITAVIWSVFDIKHPQGPQYTPPISVTMQCVINLTFQFFICYVLIWVAVTVKELTGWEWHFISNTMENAKGTIAFCPMLAILFVGTRMRALQLTNQKGAPQGWAQDGMYMATWSILLQFLMVLLIPLCTLVMEGKAVHPELDEDGNVKWKPEGKIALLCVEIIRWLAFILLYVGTICVMVGASTMTPETANGRGAVPIAKETPFAGEPYGANDVPGVPGF